MFTGTRKLVAWGATALLAFPAMALAAGTEGVGHAAYSTARRVRSAQAPEHVTIWRGGQPSLASMQLDEADPGEIPPSPPNIPGSDTPSYSGVSSEPSPILDENGGAGCTTCAGPCACTPWWAHRTFFFGQYLYLNPTGVGMAHAIQQNETGGSSATPEGRVGVVDQRYNSAYSAGFGIALGQCASIQASYTNFHSHATDTLFAPNVLDGTVASLVMHPDSFNAGSTSSRVDARSDIDYRLADVEYRRMFAGGCAFALNYLVGARYARLTQGFSQIGDFDQPTATIQTTTNIEFEGGGLRTGLDGMQRLGNTGFGVYGKGFISLVFGQFNADYEQFDLNAESLQAASNWTDERVVPILEYEVGLNWTSSGGHWRASAGYYTAFWFNTIATSEYVQAVQFANFVDLGETIAFDGLVSRLEFRF